MTTLTNRQIQLASRPQGEPTSDNFRLVELPVPELAEGQVLVRNHYLSLDPYMRGRMNAGKNYAQAQPLDTVMIGGTAGEVVASKNPGFKPGDAVVGMGGYNTFCEILSFDKPALIVPRISPREEQLIRARRAVELGVIDMLLPQEAEDPALMAKALRLLPERAPPSRVTSKLKLDGLENITDLVGEWLEPGSQKRLSVIEGGT